MEIIVVIGIGVLVAVLSAFWQKKKIDTARVKYANDPDVEMAPGWSFQLRTRRAPIVTVTPAGGGKNNPPVWRIAGRVEGLAGRSSLSLSREGWTGSLREKLGFKDVHIGDAEFDRAWTIRGSNAEQIKALLSHRAMQDAVGRVFSTKGLATISIDDKGTLAASAGRTFLNDEEARDLALAMSDFAAVLDEHVRGVPNIRVA